MLKEIFKQKFVFIECQLTELDNLFISWLQIYLGNKDKYSFSFAHWIDVPNLVITPLFVVELFAIMLSKWYHYTPEPRFQTINPEI